MAAIEIEKTGSAEGVCVLKIFTGGEEGTRSLRINNPADNNNNIVLSVGGGAHLGLLGGNLSACLTSQLLAFINVLLFAGSNHGRIQL